MVEERMKIQAEHRDAIILLNYSVFILSSAVGSNDMKSTHSIIKHESLSHGLRSGWVSEQAIYSPILQSILDVIEPKSVFIFSSAMTAVDLFKMSQNEERVWIWAQRGK